MPFSSTSPAASLAVLPFDNFSDKSECDHFATGFVEDLIVDLSHFSGLQIISSYTATRLGSGDVDEVGAAKRIEIDYLLKGSIRLNNGGLRINAKLLDTAMSKVLWAERFDAPSDSFYEIQDNIVERVVSAISSEVDHDLLASARKKPMTSLAAYDCWLRGMDRLSLGTLASDHEAREFFNQALVIDPQYSRAYAGLSMSHFNEWSCQLWELYEQSEQSAYNYAVKASQLDDTDHIVQMILGRVYLFRRQFEEAEHHIERSLELNSNDADTLVLLSSCMAFLGRAAVGQQLFKKALRLNPYRNLWYYQYGSLAYFVEKAFERSIEMALKRPLTNVWVDLPGYIAAAYAHLGNREEATLYLQMFFEAFQISINQGQIPQRGEIIDWVKLANPFKYEEDMSNLVDGLMLAGLENSSIDTPLPKLNRQQATPVGPINVFQREQDVWRILFEGSEIALIDMKGFHDIATLISSPETEIHCTELMGSESSMDENSFTIDEKARESYQQRIQDLQSEIEEAEEFNDLGRKAQLQEELLQLTEHLSKAMGLGKRSRKLNSSAERARAAVTQRIRSGIKKIAADHPILGKHLSNSIRTGIFCCYSPVEHRDWLVR